MNKINIVVFGIFLSISFLVNFTAQAASVTVFGPETFKVDKNDHSEYKRTFLQNQPSTGVLYITNGNGTNIPALNKKEHSSEHSDEYSKEKFKDRPEEVQITLNNKKIVTEKNYDPRLGQISIPINLEKINKLVIELEGRPKSSIKIEIKSGGQVANLPPVARFSFTPNTGIAPEIFSFSGVLSSDADGTITAYDWNFGDGQVAVGALVTHNYQLAGTYAAQLKVTDNLGASHTLTQNILVKPNQLPSANFVITQGSGVSAKNISVDATSSVDVDGSIVEYVWNFGDNTSLATGITAAHTYLTAGTYSVQLTIKDNKFGTATLSKQITIVNPVPPIAKLSLKTAVQSEAPSMALFDASLSTAVNGIVSYNFNFGDGQTLISAKPIVSHQFTNVGSYLVTLTAIDSNGLSSTATTNLSVIPAIFPADPALSAPSLITNAPQSIDQQINFIYQGANAVQTNVTAGAVIAEKASLIHGKVFDQDGAPISAVTVTVLNHAELGESRTRADGVFDIVVNSGEIVVLNYERNGYTSSQRKIRTLRTDFFSAPDVVLTRFDSKVSLIQMAQAGVQIHTASTVTDQDGVRTAKIVFHPNTTANLILADGSIVSSPQLSVRVTEYTTGLDGPKKMPGDLPINSAYTYAVEVSADEAIALGATSVQFSKPFNYYVDNFINAPVGGAVPLGVYDKSTACWHPDKDGLVIKILSNTNGLVQLDLNGSGLPATQSQLLAWGFDADELATLATYPVGKTLWRFQIAHFSALDGNFLGVAQAPHINNTITQNPKCTGSCCTTKGCVIDVAQRIWQESIPLLGGGGQTLNYSSDRSLGWGGSSKVKIGLIVGPVPSSLQSIEVKANIAGVTKTTIVMPTDSMDYTFVWDGLDTFGREVTQPTFATISISYFFQSEYFSFQAIPDGTTFNTPWQANTLGTAFPARKAFSIVENMPTLMNPPKMYQSNLVQSEIGGWTFSQHHQYDAKGKKLSLGTGGVIDANSLSPVVKNIVGGGVALGDGQLALNSQLRFPVYYRPHSDGSAYVSDYGNSRIRKIDANGVVSTIVGTGVSGNTGDGGLATNAQIGSPVGLVFDEDGSLFFTDATWHVIRRVDTNGIISTIAGTGTAGYSGDGGLATAAKLNQPFALFFLPDCSLVFADSGNNVLRQILPNGTIRTYAGNGVRGYSGDGGPALNASFNNLDVTYSDINGELYIVDVGNNVIRKISAGGIVKTIVGTGVAGFSGDGGPAINAKLNSPFNVVVTDRGELYFTDTGNSVIRYVDLQGNIKTVAGIPQISGYSGDNVSADRAMLNFPTGLTLLPDESLVIADSGNNLIRKLLPPDPQTVQNQYVIPSSDGSEIYIFDLAGMHLQTLFAKTGAVKWQFGYDVNKFLINITDANQNVTQILRNNLGQAYQIVSPFDQNYLITLDANGFLQKLTEPTNEFYQIQSTNTGLITKFTFPKGNFSEVLYNLDGTLQKDTSAVGGTKSFILNSQNQVVMTTGMNRTQSVMQNAIPWGAPASETFATFQDGSSSQSILSGGLKTEVSNFGQTRTHMGFDPRLQSQSQFLDDQVLTTADLQKQSFLTVNRNYNHRSAFDFDEIEVTTKDGTKTTSKAFSTTNLTTTISSGGGLSTKIQIDTKERPVNIQVGHFTPTTFNYDNRGRIAQTTQGNRSTTFNYDNFGHLNKIVDPLGRIQLFTNDESGRVLQTTLPDGRMISSSYDANSNLQSLTTPANQVHEMGFNPLDLLSSYLAPAMNGINSVTNYLFNLDRQPASIIRPDAKTLTYQYDEPYNRIKKIGTATEFVSYNYDTKARQVSNISSDNIQINYTFDGTLPLTKTYQNLITESVSYSNPGLLISSRTTAGNTVNLTYNQDQLLTGIGALTISRDQTSGLVTQKLLGVFSESFSYSTFAELSAKQIQVGASNVFAENFIRDNLGRITQKTETIGNTVNIYVYNYDLSGRLTDVYLNSQLQNHYSYDQNSNRVLKNSTTATYDIQDRIINYGGNAYTFTNNGDVASKTISNQTTNYSFDVFNQLKSVSLPNGTVISYKTDGEGKRFQRSVNNVVDRLFIYNELGQLSAELNPNGSLRSHFIYGTQAHSPDYMIKNGVTYMLIKDHLGSIRAVVEMNTGNILQQMSYDEFGIVLSDSNAGFQPFGFAGGVYDADTKLVRFGAREYDAETGRWLQKDPILFEGGTTNLYSYSNNDPINFIDPDGEAPRTIIVILQRGLELCTLHPEKCFSLPGLQSLFGEFDPCDPFAIGMSPPNCNPCAMPGGSSLPQCQKKKSEPKKCDPSISCCSGT